MFVLPREGFGTDSESSIIEMNPKFPLRPRMGILVPIQITSSRTIPQGTSEILLYDERTTQNLAA